MNYDVTAPSKVSEFKSLGVLLLILALGTGATAWAVQKYKPGLFSPYARPTPPAPPIAAPVAAKLPIATRANLPDGVTRIRDDLTTVHSGTTWINIFGKGNELSINRTPPHGEPAIAQEWQFARVVQAIVNDPRAAERYEATGAVPSLAALNLHAPQLTLTQEHTLRELYAQAFDADDDDRPAADQALTQAVSQMAIPVEEMTALHNGVEAAKKILTPDQLLLIRNGGRRPTPVPATPPKVTTAPAKK